MYYILSFYQWCLLQPCHLKSKFSKFLILTKVCCNRSRSWSLLHLENVRTFECGDDGGDAVYHENGDAEDYDDSDDDWWLNSSLAKAKGKYYSDKTGDWLLELGLEDAWQELSKFALTQEKSNHQGSVMLRGKIAAKINFHDFYVCQPSMFSSVQEVHQGRECWTCHNFAK